MGFFAPQDIAFFLISIIKVAAVVGIMLGMVAYSVVAERRFSAWIQDRIGPNRVGFIPLTKWSFWGLGQPVVDGIKFLLKEEFTPGNVNWFFFHLAPILAMAPAIVTACVIPFGSTVDLREVATWVSNYFSLGWDGATINEFNIPSVIADLDIGILFIFAVVSISVYGIVLAGWSSNSKYPFLGGIRSSAQMISYELALGLAVVPIFLLIGNMKLSEIVQYQAIHGWLIFPFTWTAETLTWQHWILAVPMLLSFFIYMISSFAETNRLPFDIPEAEQELVGGYHTEYSSMKFALFFLGEYAALIVASSVMVTLFLGGWSLPLPWFNGQPVPANWPFLAGMAMPTYFGVVHIGVFLAKVVSIIFFFIWVRWSLPRFRYDQLMNLGWKFFIPLGFANVFFAAVLLLISKA